MARMRVQAAAAPRVKRTGDRLTVNEKAMAVMSVTLLMVAALMSGGSSTPKMTTQTVTLRSGESLWSVAMNNPVTGLETAETVELIAELNDLGDAPIQAGDSLRVPVPAHGEAIAMR